VEIHYKLDGTDADINSTVYKGPFFICKSVQCNARCYRDGKPVSGMSSKIITKVEAHKAINTGDLVTGLSYTYFEGNWDSIPEFWALKPLREGIVLNFSLEPALAKEFYGFSFNGFIRIPADDMYAFCIESDDGSILWIDGQKIVDNDGLHGAMEVESVIALKKGFHTIRVAYFNKTGSDGLTVSVRSTSLKKQVIPDNLLFH